MVIIQGGREFLGVRAVDAMVKQEFKSLHDNFQNFFEYVDIQKIRTL